MKPDYRTNDPKGWCGDPGRGAALGRATIHNAPRDFSGVLTLKRVRFVDGDYDVLGTYWGSGEPLYWYASEDGEIDACTRANGREQAKVRVRSYYPRARFLDDEDAEESADDFVHGYIECMLWSSNDESDEPLDRNYSAEDITPEAMEEIKSDCARFMKTYARDLVCYCEQVETKPGDGSVMEHAGHDFWLTRNGHGCGFWDREGLLNHLGQRLTKACEKFGEVYPYVDDGKIYL